MRNGPPGMSEERWELRQLELRAAEGEEVTFTPEQLEMLHEEAAHANEVFSPQELRIVFGQGA